MRWLDGITDSMDISLGKLGDGDGQGSLVCCSPRGHKESDTTERLNNNWGCVGSGSSGISRKRPKMVLHILQCTERPLRKKVISPKCQLCPD